MDLLQTNERYVSNDEDNLGKIFLSCMEFTILKSGGAGRMTLAFSTFRMPVERKFLFVQAKESSRTRKRADRGTDPMNQKVAVNRICIYRSLPSAHHDTAGIISSQKKDWESKSHMSKRLPRSTFLAIVPRPKNARTEAILSSATVVLSSKTLPLPCPPSIRAPQSFPTGPLIRLIPHCDMMS